MITKVQIIEDIRKIKTKTGKIPSKVTYEKIGSHSLKTIKKLFGNWSSAVYESLGVKPLIYARRPVVTCATCGKATKNSKFCSSSCAASYGNRNANGRKIGKKRKPGFCRLCGEPCHYRKKRCELCKTKIKTVDGTYAVIETLTKQQASTNDTQKYRRIRNHARIIAKANHLLIECFKCGYNTHVECCHKKSIKSFDKDTPVIEINDPQNLLGLCRNHHWEFDNLTEFHKHVLAMCDVLKMPLLSTSASC